MNSLKKKTSMMVLIRRTLSSPPSFIQTKNLRATIRMQIKLALIIIILLLVIVFPTPLQADFAAPPGVRNCQVKAHGARAPQDFICTKKDDDRKRKKEKYY